MKKLSCFLLIILSMSCLLLGLGLALPVPLTAQGDELNDARQELAQKTDELNTLATSMQNTQQQIDDLQGQISTIAASIADSQNKEADLQRDLSHYIVYMYRSQPDLSFLDVLLDATSLKEVLQNFYYWEEITSYSQKLIQNQQDTQTQLALQQQALEDTKTAQEELLTSLTEEKNQLNDLINELNNRISDLEAEQRAKLTQVVQTATLFDTGDTTGWRSGIASAYGGATDPSTPNPSHTATGAICDDWSMGVAVPMAWPNYRSYFGRQVEISYNGKSIIATVTDCGNMGGGSRHLDLQPGIFKAFGFSSCNQWGLRTVQYRFL